MGRIKKKTVLKKHIHNPQYFDNENTGLCLVMCECGAKSTEKKTYREAWDDWEEKHRTDGEISEKSTKGKQAEPLGIGGRYVDTDGTVAVIDFIDYANDILTYSIYREDAQPLYGLRRSHLPFSNKEQALLKHNLSHF